MAYTPFTPTGLDQGLIPVEVENEFFEESILGTDLTPFMGSNQLSAIQVHNKEMGSGSTLHVPLLKPLDYKNPIEGNFSQISGKGEVLQFYEDVVTVNFKAKADRLPGLQFMQIATPINIFNALKPSLSLYHKKNIVYQLLKAGTLDLYPNFASGPVADRVFYSAPDANPIYNASIQTSLDAMAGNTSAYNSSGLSVAHIRKLRDMAVMGGRTFEHDKRITPLMTEKKNGQLVPTYAYLMDTVSYRSLCQDPDWKIYFGRGVIESALNQPSGLSGAYFKGMIDNIQVYECVELGSFQQKSTNLASTFAWNLFMGAQAFYLLWGKQPWFKLEYSNMDTNVEMALMEIRGQKALMFPSFNNSAVNVECGLIHSFVNITGL